MKFVCGGEVAQPSVHKLLAVTAVIDKFTMCVDGGCQ